MTGDVDLGLQGDVTEATRAPLAVIAVDDLDQALAAVERRVAARLRNRFSRFREAGVFLSAIQVGTNGSVEVKSGLTLRDLEAAGDVNA